MCQFIFPVFFKKKNRVYPSFKKTFYKVHPEPQKTETECVV